MPVRLEGRGDGASVAVGLYRFEVLNDSPPHQTAVATRLGAQLGVEQIASQEHQMRSNQGARAERVRQLHEPFDQRGLGVVARCGHPAHHLGQALVHAPDRTLDQLALAAKPLNQGRRREPHLLGQVGQREAAGPALADDPDYDVQEVGVRNQLMPRHQLNINEYSFIFKRMSRDFTQSSPNMPSDQAASAVGKVRVYIASSFDGFIAGPGDDLSWLPGADPNAAPSPDASAPAPPPALGALERRGATTHSDAVEYAGAVEYAQFMSGVGALLMGRRTFDVVLGFGGVWPYGDRPVLVATHRPLGAALPHVEAVAGTIGQLVARAKQRAEGKDVYLDGGNLIRQALAQGLVDDLIVTLVPELLGQGHALFAGLERRCSLEFTACYPYGQGMLQLHARPRPRG